MNAHYSDYVSKAAPLSDIVFDKIKAEDKDLLKDVKKEHIRANKWFLVAMFVIFLFCCWGIISSIIAGIDKPFQDITALVAFILGFLLSGYWIHDVFAGFRGIRKGVVLASSRLQEEKDNRNKTYQYVFDIYLEDTDQTLMSYQVDQEVFTDIQPGDGVVLLKTRFKVKILADPSRQGVMDVSKIKSGV